MEYPSRSEILAADARDKSSISQLQYEFTQILEKFFPFSFTRQNEINLGVSLLYDILSIHKNSIGEELASVVPIHLDSTIQYPQQLNTNHHNDITQQASLSSSSSQLPSQSQPPLPLSPPPPLTPTWRIILSLLQHVPAYIVNKLLYPNISTLQSVPEFAGFRTRVKIRLYNFLYYYLPLSIRNLSYYAERQNYGMFLKHGVFITLAHRILSITYRREIFSPYYGNTNAQDPFAMTFAGQFFVIASDLFLTCLIAPWLLYGGSILWKSIRYKLQQLQYLLWRCFSAIIPKLVPPPAVVQIDRIVSIQQQYYNEQENNGNDDSNNSTTTHISQHMHPLSAVIYDQQQQNVTNTNTLDNINITHVSSTNLSLNSSTRSIPPANENNNSSVVIVEENDIYDNHVTHNSDDVSSYYDENGIMTSFPGLDDDDDDSDDDYADENDYYDCVNSDSKKSSHTSNLNEIDADNDDDNTIYHISALPISVECQKTIIENPQLSSDIPNNVIATISNCKPVALVTMCSICLQVANQTTCTPCGHMFCWDCIYQETIRSSTCANCRQVCHPSKLLRCHQFA